MADVPEQLEAAKPVVLQSGVNTYSENEQALVPQPWLNEGALPAPRAPIHLVCLMKGTCVSRMHMWKGLTSMRNPAFPWQSLS